MFVNRPLRQILFFFKTIAKIKNYKLISVPLKNNFAAAHPVKFCHLCFRRQEYFLPGQVLQKTPSKMLDWISNMFLERLKMFHLL